MDRHLQAGILIGLLFGMPAGAVGALTVQRTLRSGFQAGILTGLGSSAADCLYASLGAFGLTAVSGFLLKHQISINLAGGGFLLLMGIGMLAERKAGPVEDGPQPGAARTFLSSFAVGITNPAAIAAFLFAFSYFGLSGGMRWYQGLGLVFGVFLGTLFWWIALSGGVSVLKSRFGNRKFFRMNQIFGIVLILCGVFIVIRAARALFCVNS